ncbi:MAG: 2,3,4,5-tetrahydropyridine-2,6-dicarboxylate N-succinyltransferase [Alphaproteobacteria bacterium]|jgi:2,3,4,5-tetrahydropyridine-2-carboxylate N-succinyltransferase|nr:2,3,4,5-tetrahydropyridine-2,6-dicarboxylate N-succinyltransferase [Alphaproteobacteria bacterium]MBP7729723.1 2,3,4,5-tetrahydropyridine-2,6-dicarboxylate N-succinyltransferase [Alphaproteobacteria bacterium]
MLKTHSPLEDIIEEAWNKRQLLSPESTENIQSIVQDILFELDRGKLRVAEKTQTGWITQSWIKKAILLSFRLQDSILMNHSHSPAYDKIPLKFQNWTADQFKAAGFRVVPGTIVRYSAYIAPGAVIMPSFINVGAYIDGGTMIDSSVRIGSCAQIGKNCHLSDNVGIGGVLEPPQADPVIIEDNCFIGACCEIVEGVFVGEGSVLGAGVILTGSTKIVDRETNAISYGRIPPYSVVVPGVISEDDPKKPSLQCAVIIKHVDEKTRSKTTINELLR